MAEYKAPIDDIRFAINDVLEFPAHYASLPGCEDATPDMVDAIVEEAAQFVGREIAPLHQVGDKHGCKFESGVVTTPPGFKAAYDLYVDNGWAGLAQPAEEGGQGLPPSLGTVVMEMFQSANHAWTMYPVLALGAIKTTREHGSDDLKRRFLNPMVEGRWTGTMCLTEAHSGSDLGLLRTKAEPNDDGSYAITGSKIFISSGEHDLAENIVHIVLARLPDSPPGIKGISLFLVPKFNVDNGGNIADRNGVQCGSIEHKMGINGNATCVLNFEAAQGFLLGQPNKGMRQMFTFINESRLMVAQQAQGAAERSYQGARDYAKERLQMRAPVRVNPEKPADPIIVHPDVRRMLMTQRAFAEGGRLLNFYCAKQVDITHFGTPEEQEVAESLLALLTPIAKGFLSEVANEAATCGIQVFGGHGYVSEWGMEQIARDVRITTLYEGTTGIQGLDLLGRKILGSNGQILEPFVAEIKEFVEQNGTNEEIANLVCQLDDKVDEWVALTRLIGARAAENPDEVNAAAFDYLMYSGYVTLAYAHAISAAVASTSSNSVAGQKLDTARFYFDRILPRTLSLGATIRSGASCIPQIC